MAFTVAELCERWNCRPKLIRRLIRDGYLPDAFRLGREWRIPKSCVTNYEARYRSR